MTRALGVALPALLGAALLAAGCSASPPSAPDAAAGSDPNRAQVVRFWGLFNEATTLRRGGRFADAARLYEEALTIDAAHEDSWYYLGWCRQEIGTYREARDAFERLVAVNPVSARGHLALGAILSSPAAGLADLPGAETHFRRAHEINGEETGPMVRLGEIFIVTGDLGQARHWLESAAHTNPKSAEAAFLSGYLRWVAGDVEAARDLYRRAVKALRAEAPVQGVLGEGDRKAGAAAAPPGPAAPAASTPARVAAPPLEAPMGEMLYSSFITRLKQPSASVEAGSIGSADLRRIYSPVGDEARRLAALLSARSS